MSFSWRQVVHYKVFDAKWATWTSDPIPVRDFRNCVVKVWTASSANLTMKAQWAISSSATDYTAPTFSSSQSVANNWDYVQMVDLQDGNHINGDTGFVVTWTDDFRLFEININWLDFIAFTVTARSAWSVTVEVQLTSNL